MIFVHTENFTIALEPGGYVMNFTAFEIVGSSEDGVLYHRRGYVNGHEFVPRVSEAQPYMSGAIKWDGCANIEFVEQRECMLHFCGRSDAQKIGRLFDKLYDLAIEHIINADKEFLA